MILILNDTAHCWENETAVAASPFECPCEFIKSTSFPFQLRSVQLHESEGIFKDKSLQCNASECRVIIFDENHSSWQWALPNISAMIEGSFYITHSFLFFFFFFLKVFLVCKYLTVLENVMLCRLLSKADIAFQGV